MEAGPAAPPGSPVQQSAEGETYPMAQTELMWSLGLNDIDAAQLASYAGDGFTLRNWARDGLPAAEDMRASAPLLIWVQDTFWESMPEAQRLMLQRWETPLRILIQSMPGVADETLDAARDARPQTDEIDEQALEGRGFLTAVHHPLSRDAVREVLRRAKELSSLYTDIIAMTKEILLERELLSRKTDQLTFLNRILSRASESLDVATILCRAQEDMDMLFPLRALMAVFWRDDLEETGAVEADVYASPELAPQVRKIWVDDLLEKVQETLGTAVAGYNVTILDTQPGADLESPALGQEEILYLPMASGLTTFGLMALVSRKGQSMGRDQAQTLRAATNHLALALKNALLYREAQFKAEFDGLTRIHNRQGFDRRLREEVARHRRYGQPMSLLIMDIDFFKAVNDTHGHEAGDLVLREMGRILSENLRSTDFAARYGGEEFAVILPHTPSDNAIVLAERLRVKIADQMFHYLDTTFQVTASFGVAAIDAQASCPDEELLRKADKALYRAKADGRNLVRFAVEDPQVAVCQN